MHLAKEIVVIFLILIMLVLLPLQILTSPSNASEKFMEELI